MVGPHNFFFVFLLEDFLIFFFFFHHRPASSQSLAGSSLQTRFLSVCKHKNTTDPSDCSEHLVSVRTTSPRSATKVFHMAWLV